MHNLLLFGILNHILFLSINGQNDYSIAMICIQAVVLSSKMLKQNNLVLSVLRITTIICWVFNALILQRPIAYMTTGCCFVMAYQTWGTCFLSAMGVFVLSFQFDVLTICEAIAFVVISSLYIYYLRRVEQPDTTRLSESSPPPNQKLGQASLDNIPQKELPENSEFNIYQKLLTYFPDGVIIIDNSYKIHFMNQALRTLMNEKQDSQAFTSLLNLRNAIDGTQDKYQQLFLRLEIKMRNKQYSMDDHSPSHYIKLKSANEQEDQMGMGIDFVSAEERIYNNLSQTSIVKLETEQVFKQLNERDVRRSQLDLNQMSPIKFFQEISMVCQDETQKILHIIMKPYKVSDTGFIVMIVRDITHINEIAMLEKTNYNRSQMLYQVAHEFRTPLGLIMDFANNLAPKLDLETRTSQLNPIKSMVGQLQSLVNDLLDVGQLKAGKFNLNKSSFRIKELMHEIVEMMKIQAKNRGLYLELELDKNVPNYVYSDPNRLKQIIMNLVTNAIKFTKYGGVRLVVQPDEDQILIRVIDTGIGIAKTEQSKLFNEFTRVENVYNPMGCGLGLMISNILAKKLGEEIQLYSEGHDRGSSFSFKIRNLRDREDSGDYCFANHEDDEGSKLILPNFTLRQLSKEESPFISVTNACKCKQILIVDDEPFNIASIEAMLSHRKELQIDKAFSGIEALQKLDTYQGCESHSTYQIVFLDLQMPIMDGYQTAKLIKEKRIDTHLIACTAHPIDNVIIEGFDGYLQKPVKLDKLNKLLSVQL